MELSKKEKHQTLKQKSQKSLARTIKKDLIYTITPRNKDAILAPYLNLAKYAIKQNYILVVVLKPA